MQRRILHIYKSLILLSALPLVISCSKGGETQAHGPSTQVDEFTAFHPVTGLPLKPEDLTEEMLKEDIGEDVGFENSAALNAQAIGGDNHSMEIHEEPVDVETVKDVMLFGYTPTGEYNSHLSPQCYRTEIEKMVSSYTGPTSNLAQDLQSWAHRCEKELSMHNTNNIATVLKFSNVNYDLNGNSIKNIEIEFDDQSRVNALLGLKKGKRPLVIFKTGVYSNAEDGGVTRNFFMHLFDESPFHLLYLANVTGTDYMKKNGAVALGGMDEGKQILKVVEMLSHDPQYRDLIEDIHVVGVSLGSHGVLYSSLYNSFDGNATSKIKSAVALCPVVNLEPTIQSVFKPTVAGLYYAILSNQTFHDVYDSIPILREYLPSAMVWTQSQMYDASTKATLWHYKERTSKTPWDMEPLSGNRVHELSDFWEYNNFIKYADKVTTPTLIVHSRDDFLVQSIFNSDELLKKTQNNNSEIGIVEFQNGSHCGLNVATSWPTISSLLRSFILKHSTYIEKPSDKILVSFKAPTLNSYNKISKYTFLTEKNNSQVFIDIEYFDSSLLTKGRACNRYDPLFAPSDCYKNKTEKLNINAFESAGIKVPTSNFEVQRLNRWLNTHVELLNKDSESILGNRLWPTSMELSSRADFQN